MAERAKSSNNQVAQNCELKERIVIELTAGTEGSNISDKKKDTITLLCKLIQSCTKNVFQGMGD
ncbi:MAG: hypothetical protein ICV63_11235 [Coleofasciculus sp. Co-bin14]|nr:hypothetical protein [Coleofasciculus sp. Co-bin14]